MWRGVEPKGTGSSGNSIYSSAFVKIAVIAYTRDGQSYYNCSAQPYRLALTAFDRYTRYGSIGAAPVYGPKQNAMPSSSVGAQSPVRQKAAPTADATAAASIGVAPLAIWAASAPA